MRSKVLIMSRLVPALLLLLAAVFVSTAAHAQGGSVNMVEDEELNAQDGHYAFSPETITVSMGDTVNWDNSSSGAPHTVTADDKSFDSGNVDEGGTYSHTFSSAGTFAYFCEYHPGMVGKVVVEEAAGGGNQQGGDEQTPETPNTGAGGLAGGAGVPVGPIAAAFSLLLAGGYGVVRKRR